jgi:hypothetical protein
VARQPRRWADLVVNRIPFEMAAIGAGVLAVGYARGPTEAVGLEVDVAKAAVKESFSQRTESDIAHVFPAPGHGEKFVIALENQGPLRSAVHLARPPSGPTRRPRRSGPSPATRSSTRCA